MLPPRRVSTRKSEGNINSRPSSSQLHRQTPQHNTTQVSPTYYQQQQQSQESIPFEEERRMARQQTIRSLHSQKGYSYEKTVDHNDISFHIERSQAGVTYMREDGLVKSHKASLRKAPFSTTGSAHGNATRTTINPLWFDQQELLHKQTYTTTPMTTTTRQTPPATQQHHRNLHQQQHHQYVRQTQSLGTVERPRTYDRQQTSRSLHDYKRASPYEIDDRLGTCLVSLSYYSSQKDDKSLNELLVFPIFDNYFSNSCSYIKISIEISREQRRISRYVNKRRRVKK